MTRRFCVKIRFIETPDRLTRPTPYSHRHTAPAFRQVVSMFAHPGVITPATVTAAKGQEALPVRARGPCINDRHSLLIPADDGSNAHELDGMQTPHSVSLPWIR